MNIRKNVNPKIFFPKKLHLFKLWFGLGLLYVIFIFYYSLIPDPPLPTKIDHSDKVYHFIAYALLTFWFCQIFEKKSYPFLTTTFILQGVVIEFLQALTDYRTLELGDILANSSGVLVLYLLLLLKPNYRQFLKKIEQGYFSKEKIKSKTMD